MTTITDIEKALTDARELEEYWRNEGWQSLQLEEEVTIKDIYVTVQPASQFSDPEVWVHIELEEKIYVVPLDDVSAIHVNDSLVIGTENLYSDWVSRVESRLGERIDIINHVQVLGLKGKNWNRYTYLSPIDGKIRIVSKIIE